MILTTLQLPLKLKLPTVKLPAFLQRFQTKILTLRVNESKITAEDELIKIILQLKIPMYQITTKKICFEYFCRIVIHALALKLRKASIYVFQSILGYCNIQAIFYLSSLESHLG